MCVFWGAQVQHRHRVVQGLGHLLRWPQLGPSSSPGGAQLQLCVSSGASPARGPRAGGEQRGQSRNVLQAPALPQPLTPWGVQAPLCPQPCWCPEAARKTSPCPAVPLSLLF